MLELPGIEAELRDELEAAEKEVMSKSWDVLIGLDAVLDMSTLARLPTVGREGGEVGEEALRSGMEPREARDGRELRELFRCKIAGPLGLCMASDRSKHALTAPVSAATGLGRARRATGVEGLASRRKTADSTCSSFSASDAYPRAPRTPVQLDAPDRELDNRDGARLSSAVIAACRQASKSSASRALS
jgi:hypothetical protein